MIVTASALRDRVGVFVDRHTAGLVLAELLPALPEASTTVLAIPAGGVPVAAPLARTRRLALDVAPVSKVLFPWTTESGFGAVAFDGTVWLDEQLRARHRLTDQQVATAVAEARTKVERRVKRFRRGPLDLTGRTAVLVDDGIAGGATMRTAVEAVRRGGAASIVIAVPTAHEAALELFEPMVDTLVVANVRSGREFAVASAYLQWDDVSEDEAARLLAA